MPVVPNLTPPRYPGTRSLLLEANKFAPSSHQPYPKGGLQISQNPKFLRQTTAGGWGLRLQLRLTGMPAASQHAHFASPVITSRVLWVATGFYICHCNIPELEWLQQDQEQWKLKYNSVPCYTVHKRDCVQPSSSLLNPSDHVIQTEIVSSPEISVANEVGCRVAARCRSGGTRLLRTIFSI